MTFHTRTEVEALRTDSEIEALREQDEDDEAVSDPKHWHVFHASTLTRK